MSVNKRDSTTGELVTLASGTRMWVGTKTAHDLAVQQGTMPNNCMVCITDDANDFTSGKAVNTSYVTASSNLFYLVKAGWCKVYGNMRIAAAADSDAVVYTGLPTPLSDTSLFSQGPRGLAWKAQGTSNLHACRAVNINSDGSLGLMWGSRDWATEYQDSENEWYVMLEYPVEV